MSVQEQVARLAMTLSEEDALVMLQVIRKFQPQQAGTPEQDNDGGKMAAFRRWEKLSAEIRAHLPENFDPQKELLEAVDEKYGRIG